MRHQGLGLGSIMPFNFGGFAGINIDSWVLNLLGLGTDETFSNDSFRRALRRRNSICAPAMAIMVSNGNSVSAQNAVYIMTTNQMQYCNSGIPLRRVFEDPNVGDKTRAKDAFNHVAYAPFYRKQQRRYANLQIS
jgi:hypothetical protein